MTLEEARLPDLLIDLHDQYGAAFPKPAGLVIKFNVIDDNTTYQKAKAEIEALLAVHGIIPSSLTITPGPEDKTKTNRSIKLEIAKDLLM
jgi:hypothetical protein